MVNSIFDQLREAAKRTAQELDEKYDLKNKFEPGVIAANQAASETARKAGETFNQATATARERKSEPREVGRAFDRRICHSRQRDRIATGGDCADSGGEAAAGLDVFIAIIDQAQLSSLAWLAGVAGRWRKSDRRHTASLAAAHKTTNRFSNLKDYSACRAFARSLAYDVVRARRGR